jgi:hypothetical protein
MLVINFSHPLTAEQLSALEGMVERPIDLLVEVPCQLDVSRPFADQVRELVDRIGLDGTAWQTTPLVINPPSLAPIAAMVLAEIHGRAGYFPPILRLRPVLGSIPPRYELAEVINLQEVRDTARTRRSTEEGNAQGMSVDPE